MLNKKDVETYVGSSWESKISNTKHKIVKIVLNNKEMLFSKENIFHITDESNYEVEEFSGDKILKFFILKSLEVKSPLTKHESDMVSNFLDKLFYNNAIDIALKNRDKESFNKLVKNVD